MMESSGTSRYLILGMLAHVPLTGYSIRKWIASEYSHFWQASFGQIYPALKQLVRDGLAQSDGKSAGTDGRGQIEYSITDKGRDALKRWLRKEPEIEKLRYEILLKVSFGDQAEPGVLLRHLDDFIARSDAALRQMNEYLSVLRQFADQEEANHVYSRLTALCGAYHYSAMAEWAREAKRILEKEADPT